jgi:hypothetical protein
MMTRIWKVKFDDFPRHSIGRADKVIRSLDRKMPVGCRKCRKLLSIIAIKRNIYFISAFFIDAQTENLLDNRYNSVRGARNSNSNWTDRMPSAQLLQKIIKGRHWNAMRRVRIWYRLQRDTEQFKTSVEISRMTIKDSVVRMRNFTSHQPRWRNILGIHGSWEGSLTCDWSGLNGFPGEIPGASSSFLRLL